MKKLEVDFVAFHEAVIMKVISAGDQTYYCDGVFIEPNGNMDTLLLKRCIMPSESESIKKKFAFFVFDSEDEARAAVIRFRSAINAYNEMIERK